VKEWGVNKRFLGLVCSPTQMDFTQKWLKGRKEFGKLGVKGKALWKPQVSVRIKRWRTQD